MAITDRAAEAIGGPRGGTTWYDEGMAGQVGFTKSAANVNTTTLEEIVFVIPNVNKVIQPGRTYTEDALGSDNVIQACYGVYVVSYATWAANIAQLTVQFMLRRAGNVIGGGAFAGWAAASNAALTQWVPTFVPFLTGNTALMPGVMGTAVAATYGGAYLPVQPLDVITCQFVTTGNITLTSLLQVNLVLI